MQTSRSAASRTRALACRTSRHRGGSGRSLVRVALLAGPLMLVVACGTWRSGEPSASPSTPGPPRVVAGVGGRLTIGALDGEQMVLANLYAEGLRTGGYDAVVRPFASREALQPALERGEVDVYPDYVGVLLGFLGGGPTNELEASLADLRARLGERRLAALDPAPAEDKHALAVTRETARRYELHAVSDLAPIAPQLVFGGPPDCDRQASCLPGLERVYGLRFARVEELDAGGPLTKDALETGAVDVGIVFTTDGDLGDRGLRLLRDDRLLQPVDNVVPVVRVERLTDGVAAILNRLSAKLTTERLSELNRRVADGQDPATVVKD